MRAIFFLYLFSGAALHGFAAPEIHLPAADRTTVSGRINLDEQYVAYITVRGRNSGLTETTAEIPLSRNGRFSWESQIQAPCFISLSIYPKARNRQLVTALPLYLKPGSHTRFVLNYNDTSLVSLSSGNLDNNNRALIAYYRLSALKDISLYRDAPSAEDIQAGITSYLAIADSLITALKIQDASVKQYLTIWSFNDYQDAQERLSGRNRASSNVQAASAFVKDPVTVYDNELTLFFPASSRHINRYISSLVKTTGGITGLAALKNKTAILDASFSCAALKEWITAGALENTIRGYTLKDTADFNRELVLFTEIAGNITNSQKRAALINDFKNLRFTMKGAPLPDILFKDINDQPVSLQSFAGKYIYIDLWASWCVPCIKEIPHLRQLEKESADKNIVFISISIDENPVAWKDKVKALGLEGHQLHTAGSRYEKLMNVSGIPHFLLYDPGGKLMIYRAPRPSSKEVRSILP